MSILLITHDLGVVAQLADYVYVMYAGRIVEHASVEDLFSGPLHPYTQGLLRCLPRLSDREDRLEVIPGNVPDPRSFPAGCRFHPRCVVSAQAARGALGETVRVDSAPFGCVLKRCVEYDPRDPAGVLQLRELRPGHFVACGEADVSPRVPRYRS